MGGKVGNGRLWKTVICEKSGKAKKNAARETGLKPGGGARRKKTRSRTV